MVDIFVTVKSEAIIYPTLNAGYQSTWGGRIR